MMMMMMTIAGSQMLTDCITGCKIHEFVYIRIYVTELPLKVKNYLRWWYIKPFVCNTSFIYHHLGYFLTFNAKTVT